MSSELSPALTIPHTVAKHVLGDSAIRLADGDLNLYLHSSPEEQVGTEQKDKLPIMTLSVGKAAFPLFRSTLFGTLANDEAAYVFAPPITEAEGYVKIILPDGVKEPDTPLSRLRDTFENILLEHGLLKEGIEAAGDEVGRSVRESTYRIARRIQEATKELDSDSQYLWQDMLLMLMVRYLRENPPTKSPVEVPRSFHTTTSTSSSATESLFRAASLVTSAVGSAASSAGSWMTARVVPATEENVRRLNATSNAYDSSTRGIGDGIADVKNSLANGASSILENDLGPEARSVSGNLARSVDNVVGVAGQATRLTSGATLASGALNGAVSTENRLHKEKNGREQYQKEGSGH